MCGATGAEIQGRNCKLLKATIHTPGNLFAATNSCLVFQECLALVIGVESEFSSIIVKWV